MGVHGVQMPRRVFERTCTHTLFCVSKALLGCRSARQRAEHSLLVLGRWSAPLEVVRCVRKLSGCEDFFVGKGARTMGGITRSFRVLFRATQAFSPATTRTMPVSNRLYDIANTSSKRPSRDIERKRPNTWLNRFFGRFSAPMMSYCEFFRLSSGFCMLRVRAESCRNRCRGT